MLKPSVQTFANFLFSLVSGPNAGDPEEDTKALEDGGVIQWNRLGYLNVYMEPRSWSTFNEL